MIASRRISRKLNSEHATHAPIDEFADTLVAITWQRTVTVFDLAYYAYIQPRTAWGSAEILFRHSESLTRICSFPEPSSIAEPEIH